jgi:hypothetical protein
VTPALVGGIALLMLLFAPPADGPKPAMPAFDSSFESGTWEEWKGYGAKSQPEMYPPAEIVDPLDEGIPRIQGRRAARLEVRPEDARADRTHAKLIRSWSADRVSGSYRAWYYVPSGYTLRGRAWVNIFQFKEPYSCDGYCSDPSWWMVLVGAKRGDGIRRGAPVAEIERWESDGRRRRVERRRPFPTGRWVEVRADVRQGERIDYYIDGRRFDTALQEEYPVGPMHGSRSLEWAFGVGSYTGTSGDPARYAANGPLYVDAVSFRPFAADGQP